ncbi:MAG: hypothetical protein AAGD38_13670 [Acidobacteriota bacterium]
MTFRHSLRALAIGSLAMALVPVASFATGWTGDRSAVRPKANDGPKIVTRASTTDPSGDTIGTETAPDVTSYDASVSGSNLVLSLEFAGPVSPASSAAPNSIGGFLDLDIDQNGATGDVSWSEFLGGVVNGLGNEFYVDLNNADADSAVLVDDNDDVAVAEVNAAWSATGVRIFVPLNLLDNDDGLVDTGAVVGTLNVVTDVVPNDGVLSSTQGDGALLQNGRFQVDVTWRDFDGNTGTGTTFVQSIDSAVIYFFGPNNWEFLVKVLDGCGANNHWWVFAAATTNVEYTLTVTDLQADVSKSWPNPLGVAAPAITDTQAFATCP